MTTKFQLSTKLGEDILLVSAEDADPGAAYQNFRVAAEDAGLNGKVEAIVNGANAPAAAVVNAAQGRTYAPAGAPAPAQQPAAVPGAPRCHHGPKTRRTGTNARGAWVGWFCPSPKGTPDQCAPDFE
jgi:hypothetical protein